MSGADPRGDDVDNPVKTLLRSGLRGILAVAFAVVIVGAASAAVALAVAVTF